MTSSLTRAVAGADTSDMRVCSSCGARALQSEGSCELCAAALNGRVLTAPLLADEFFWVQVRAEYQCQSCRKLSPLNHVDADGAFECAHCHARQDANPVVWEEGLAFGHAVAELGGPNAASRRPRVDLSSGESFDLSGLGSERTLVSMHIGEQHRYQETGSPAEVEYRTLRMQASPGHPVCRRCRALLKTRIGTVGRVTTSCPACSVTETYAVQAEALELHPGFVGAIANAYRAGEVATPQTVSSLEPWWLLFRGVSPERQLLADAAQEREAEDREEANVEQRSQTAQREQLTAERELEHRTGRNNLLLACALTAFVAAAVGLGLLLK